MTIVRFVINLAYYSKIHISVFLNWLSVKILNTDSELKIKL